MSNNSIWTPQAARGVALTGRVPAFSLGTFIVATVGGAVYRSSKWNLHASRGRIKVDRTQAALVPGYTGEDANFFWQAMWPTAAAASLNPAYPLSVRQELAAFAGGDSYAPLVPQQGTPAYADYQARYNQIADHVIPGNGPSSHVLPLMLATGHAMGVEAYNQWHEQPGETNLHGAFNVSAKYNIFDNENYATPAGQDTYTFVLTARQAAGVQQGMIDAYNQDTRTPTAPYTAASGTKPAYAPVWITNALESFSSNAHFFSNADPDGNPHYFNLQPAAYRDSDLIASLQATGGYMSIEPYMKCIWHEGKSFYQYNTDGTVKMLNGQPVFNRTGYAWTESGFAFTVDQGEGEHLLHEIQRYLGVVQAARKQINGGTMPVRFSDRMAGASNVGLAPWLRPTNERGNYIPGVTVSNPNNNRPVPGWITEGLLIMTGIMVGWKGLQLMFSSFFGNNSSGNVPDPGEKNWNDDTTGETDQGTDGPREYAYKAWHRLSLLGDILTNDGKILSFGHHYRNSNTGTGDRFIEKTPLEGKICLHNGQMVILVAGFLPGQDLGKSTTVTLWVNTGAGARVVTTLTLYDRKVNWVIIPLPGDLTNIDARNVYAAYSDMIGGVNNVIKTGELNYAIPAGTTVPTAGGSVTPPAPPASTGQRLKFSMQNNFDPNVMAGSVGKYDQLGLASITHEDARTENGTFFPAVILPPYFPDFIGAGGNAIGIYTQRWHYQLTRSAWGRTVQLTNQIGHLRSHNIPYTFRGCVGVDWYSDSDNKFSDLMGKADAMKRSDGTTVAANNNSACPRLPLLKAYKASVAAGTPDTGNPWHWVRQYIVYMTNLVKTDLQSGLCEAIGFTLGGRWEDTYPYDGDGNSVFWIADYDPATIADFQATKNTSYTPGFDAGNRSRNTFSSAGGKLWYLYCEDNYIILKDWITSVIHEAVPTAPGVADFGQYGGSGGDATAARMLNFPRIAQSCARIKVNPDISQSAGYVSDVVRATGKVMEMETDNGPWYQLSNSDMSDKINAYFQAGFKDVQFGQAGDPALWSRILGYATYFTSHHALGNVPTINPVGDGGTYPLSTLLSGNQDNSNLWTLAGGNATDRISFTLINDL